MAPWRGMEGGSIPTTNFVRAYFIASNYRDDGKRAEVVSDLIPSWSWVFSTIYEHKFDTE